MTTPTEPTVSTAASEGGGSTDTSGPSPTSSIALGIPIAVGCLVALGLGAYGGLHHPTGRAVNIAGFSSGLAAKTWLSSVAFVLAIVQMVTAAGMWGRLGLGDKAWTAPLHRWSGRLAVLFLLPVVVHCLYALGFQTGSVRVLLHSLFGCFFFGAFTAKMLALPRSDLPGWAIPALGGALSTAIVVVWLTSAAWFFSTFGLTL
jgi:hypothetical protein